jgi:hypothetical protein
MNVCHPLLADAVPLLEMSLPPLADTVPLFRMSLLPGGGPGGGGGGPARVPLAPDDAVPNVEAKLSRSVESCCKSCDNVLAVVPLLLTDDESVSEAEVPDVLLLPADDDVPPNVDNSDCRSVRSWDTADVPLDVIEFPSVAPVLPPVCDEEPNAINAKFVPSESGDDVPPVTAPEPVADESAADACAAVPPPVWLDCAAGVAWYAASCAQRSFCPVIELNTVQSPLVEVTNP